MDNLTGLRAIDTNIVIRLLLRDDPGQVALVDTLVAEGGLFVPLTVLVESEWVMRAVYRLDRATIAELLGFLVDIEGVMVADPAGVRWALERHAQGADFADMIHLVASDTDTFATLDRGLARDAGDDPPVPIETLA